MRESKLEITPMIRPRSLRAVKTGSVSGYNSQPLDPEKILKIDSKYSSKRSSPPTLWKTRLTKSYHHCFSRALMEPGRTPGKTSGGEASKAERKAGPKAP